MPSVGVEIYLPCEVFDVEVQLGPRGGISPLELLVLRALKEGVEYFDDLVNLFQIGYRPMLNLISDLWRQNYVALDFGAARLEVVPAVKDKLGTPEESTLRGGERSQRVVTLMQELVCGHILLAAAVPPRTHANRIAPQIKPYGSFLQAPNTEIRRAIEGLIASWSKDVRPLSVLAANLRVADIAAPGVGQRRLLAVEVQCTAGESGRVDLRIVQPVTKLDGGVRRDLERMLAQLVEERADDVFSRFLSESAGQRREPVRVPVRQRVHGLSARLKSVAPDKLSGNLAAAQELHEELAQEAQAALESIVEQHARRSRLRLLTSRSEIVGAVRSALGDTLHQVVLASPAARPEAVNGTAVPLKKLLQKGQRRAFVLWGQEPDERLDPAVKSAFLDLESVGRFFWPRHSGRSNMSFLLRDDDLCIVSSSPLLDDVPGNAVTLGLKVESLQRSALCPIVREQLERVARIFPDFNMAAKLATTMAKAMENAEQPLPDLPRIPMEPREGLQQADRMSDRMDASIGRVLLETWLANWVVFTAGLAGALATLGDSAELVHDGRHRDVLLEALASSPSFVIVGSAELSSRGFDPTLRQAMAAAAKGGARIVMLHGRARRYDEAALQRMRELADGSAGRIVSIPCDLQGGLLLVDDWLLVGGFPFLARAARWDEGSPSPLPTQHETGLLVRSARIAGEALDSLQTHLPQIAKLRPRAAVAVEDLPATPAHLPFAAGSEHLQALLARLASPVPEVARRAPGPRSEKIRQWLGEAHAEGVPVEDLARLIPTLARRDQSLFTAACLQLEASGSEVQAELLRRLCADCWQAGAFHETTILRSRLQEGPAAGGLPSVWLARIAAVRHHPQQLAALLNTPALLQPLDREEEVALACIGCSALALRGVSEAWVVLDAQRSGLPPVLATWADEILNYWNDIGHAVPRSLFFVPASAGAPEVRARKAHDALREAFDAAANVSFSFVLGKKTWWWLFHEQGELGRLGAAIRSHELAVVHAWLTNASRLGRTAEVLLDTATREAAERDSQLMEERIIGAKRVSCLQRLDELIERMVEWVELQGVLSGGQAVHLARVSRLAVALAATRDSLAALERSAADNQAMSLPLIRALRADFAALFEG